jgi:hypothetical protein
MVAERTLRRRGVRGSSGKGDRLGLTGWYKDWRQSGASARLRLRLVLLPLLYLPSRSYLIFQRSTLNIELRARVKRRRSGRQQQGLQAQRGRTMCVEGRVYVVGVDAVRLQACL